MPSKPEVCPSRSAWGSLGAAAALDVVYLVAALAFAAAMLRTFRRRGFVTRYM